MSGTKQKERKMGREAILKAVKKNKPAIVTLPEIDLKKFEEDLNLLETFKEKVQLVGGKAIELQKGSVLDTEIQRLYPQAKQIVSTTKASSLGTVSISEETDPHKIKDIDLAIIKAGFAVAENGAVWIQDDDFKLRVLPFISNDLVIILEKENLCLHMHEAYKTIGQDKQGFGLFLSGPSKTADIEQCLVIGAQGAMSLTVFLV